MSVEISGGGGTLRCAAFSKNADGSWPSHAATNLSAESYMESSSVLGPDSTFSQKISIACQEPRCDAILKTLPGNTTLRIFCGVEDIAQILHL